jgi:hypothetical protein
MILEVFLKTSISATETCDKPVAAVNANSGFSKSTAEYGLPESEIFTYDRRQKMLRGYKRYL